MTTMNVLDAAGATVAVEKPLTPGQALMAASSPVVIASDQSALAVTVSGVATAANQTSTNTKLDTLHADLTAALPAGANVIGGVTIADGSDAAEGAKGDAAYAGSGSASLIAIGKGMYAALVAATPAGSAIIGKVGIDQTTPGTTNAVVATGNVASAASDSGNPVKIGGVFNTSMTTLTTGQRGDMQLNAKGGVRIELTDSAATAISFVTPADATSNGVSVLPVKTYAAVYNGTTWDRATTPNAVSRIASCAATTNATSGKASAGKVHAISAYNTTASLKYLKIYNKASAPTVGTDTPVMTIALPPTGNFILEVPNGGMHFATGIAYALTGAAADADTTALAAGDVVGLNISYN